MTVFPISAEQIAFYLIKFYIVKRHRVKLKMFANSRIMTDLYKRYAAHTWYMHYSRENLLCNVQSCWCAAVNFRLQFNKWRVNTFRAVEVAFWIWRKWRTATSEQRNKRNDDSDENSLHAPLFK